MKKKYLIFFIGLIWSNIGYNAEAYLPGSITNITSTTEGLMIMLDTGVPTNCAGTPNGWMLIPAAIV